MMSSSSADASLNDDTVRRKDVTEAMLTLVKGLKVLFGAR